jgi:hypothetical protein
MPSIRRNQPPIFVNEKHSLPVQRTSAVCWSKLELPMLTGSGSSFASLRAALAASVLVLSSAGVAQAQWFAPRYYQPPIVLDELTPREILGRVRNLGYSSPSRPEYRDDVVIVSATDTSGRRFRLVLDAYSGRLVERFAAPQPRQNIVQRTPDQGATIRNTVPEQTERTVATPDRPTTIRREPILPPQTTTPTPPKSRIVQPEKPVEAPKPPEASVGTGTRDQPRRIDITPPAALDAPPERPKAPSNEPPINSVPPVGLE